MAADAVIVTLVIGTCALSAALLAWFAFDVGTTTLARYRATFTEQTRFQAREFFLFIDPYKLFAANLALIGLGGMLVWLGTGNVLLALAAASIVVLVPRLLYRWLRRRRLARYETQLPDALMALAGSIRAGSSLVRAMDQLVRESPAPLGQEFGLLLREQRLGVPLEQALTGLSRRVPTQTNVLVVSALRISLETGGELAQALERTAATVRSRLQMEGKITALTAQGRLQAWILGALPVVLLLVLNRMNPDDMAVFWETQLGWSMLGLIAVLEILGVYMIRRIVAIDV